MTIKFRVLIRTFWYRFILSYFLFLSFKTEKHFALKLLSFVFSYIFSVTKQREEKRNNQINKILIRRLSPAKSHGDSAGGDFGDAGSEDDGGRGIGAGQASGKSEGNGESVRYADDDVTNDLAGSEVLLFVLVEQALLLGL